MKTLTEIQQTIVNQAKSGAFPKHLYRPFYKEIELAHKYDSNLDGYVWAEAIYGGDSGLIFSQNSVNYKTHDFYFIDTNNGIVSRWFAGIDINDLKVNSDL